MKKVKVTFWLLGFGCGIALAGMIGTLLTLRIDISSQRISTRENDVVDELIKEKQDDVEKKSNEVSSIDSSPDNGIERDDNNGQILMENEELSFAADDQTSIVEQQNEAETYREVSIPNASSANEICTILENAGIVENGKDFLSYIKEHKKQTRLKNGTLSLPTDASYETLLELLLI